MAATTRYQEQRQPQSQQRRRYMHNGSIIGDPGLISKPLYSYIDWKRVASIVAPLLFFVLTNPVNQKVVKNIFQAPSPSSKKFKRKTMMSEKITHYGVFSLQERIDGVVISAVQQQFLCPYKNLRNGDICEWMADHLCHQKPILFDPKDLPYTTHRLLCAILILSAFIKFCCPNAPPRRVFENPIVDGFLVSPFYASQHLLLDLLFETTCVHPTLREMSKVLPKLNQNSIFCFGNNIFDFTFASFVVIFVIGGGANIVASRVGRQQTYITGFAPVIAASLGYCHRIVIRNPIVLMTAWGCDMTAIRIFWSAIAWIVWRYPRTWFPRVVSWLAAGLAGSLLAKYHLENIDVWGDIWNFIGWNYR